MSKQQSLALADDHVDKYHTRAFPVPVIIVATRYDEFKDVESAKRRALLQAIRFVAHLNGASFVCSSNSEKAARDLVSCSPYSTTAVRCFTTQRSALLRYQARAQVAAMSFTTQLRPVFQTDIEKPVAVQWGASTVSTARLVATCTDLSSTRLIKQVETVLRRSYSILCQESTSRSCNVGLEALAIWSERFPER